MEHILEDILRKEGIASRNIEPLSGGQVNSTFLVGGKYVVRIGTREDAFQRLKCETELMRSLAGEVPVPEIYSFGQQGGFVYQIQGYLPGQKLYSVWTGLTCADQERIVAELAGYLTILHSRTMPFFGYGRDDTQPFSSWLDFLTNKFNQTEKEIHDLQIQIFPGILEFSKEYFDKHKHVLEGGTPVQNHGDLTLANILVDYGRISAMLDFEYSLQAPRDYELWTLEAFCLYPNDWAEESNETYHPTDFYGFIPLLQKHYPELFDLPHLRQRVDLYQVEAALSSYLSWRKANLATIPPDKMAGREFYMARITNFIFRNGIRLF